MSVEANKSVIRKFFLPFQRGNSLVPVGSAEYIDPLELVSSDVVWWIAGERSNRGSKKFAGTWKGVDRFAALIKALYESFDRIESLDIRCMTAEDDRVSVELEGKIYSKNGTLYNNLYHMMFVIKDGKIKEVREYLDTALVAEVFG